MNNRCFTLIEIIMVVALIAVLTGIAVGGYSYAMGSARESATRATLKQLETALENAKAKHGFYLPDKDNKIYIFKDNQADAAGLASSVWDKPGLKDCIADFLKTLDTESLRQYVGADGAVCDAWGTPIVYKAPDKDKKKPFSLRSKGPDGEDSDDDITN